MAAEADVGRYPPMAASSIELQCFSPFRHHVFTPMRHLALTLPAPANRACFFASHEGRSRETRSLLDGHFAIERLARNRSQTPESYERTQLSQVAGIPQRVVEEADGTRNRNELYLRHVDGSDGAKRAHSGSHGADPDTGDSRRMLDCAAGAMASRCRGEELAKSAEIGRTLAHFGTPAEAAIENSQSHGALAFMATEQTPRKQ
jgi:hypothetical protein